MYHASTFLGDVLIEIDYDVAGTDIEAEPIVDSVAVAGRELPLTCLSADAIEEIKRHCRDDFFEATDEGRAIAARYHRTEFELDYRSRL